MEQTNETIIVEKIVVVKPEGQGLAITGFILALVSLILPMNVIAVGAGSAIISYIGIALCVISVLLCLAGMNKLKKTGGNRGLAIAGLVIGLVALGWSAYNAKDVPAGIEARNKELKELNNDLEKLQRDLQNM